MVLERDGVAYATSNDVAAFFGKNHKDVLRDARNLLKNLTGANLRWFTEATYRDEKGEERPCIEMTRDGLALLAMGFTGAKALTFKVKYIEAFNRMEGQLRLATENSLREALETEAELRAALASRSGGKVMGFSADACKMLGGIIKKANGAQDKRPAESADKLGSPGPVRHGRSRDTGGQTGR